MTFDRLKPAFDSHYYLTATKRNGNYRALAVPATLSIGPNTADSFARIDGIPEAIQQNDWITEDRRRFLIDRVPYWRRWVNERTIRSYNAGHWE